jgi:hypothetical protein
VLPPSLTQLTNSSFIHYLSWKRVSSDQSISFRNIIRIHVESRSLARRKGVWLIKIVLIVVEFVLRRRRSVHFVQTRVTVWRRKLFGE